MGHIQLPPELLAPFTAMSKNNCIKLETSKTVTRERERKKTFSDKNCFFDEFFLSEIMFQSSTSFFICSQSLGTRLNMSGFPV